MNDSNFERLQRIKNSQRCWYIPIIIMGVLYPFALFIIEEDIYFNDVFSHEDKLPISQGDKIVAMSLCWPILGVDKKDEFPIIAVTLKGAEVWLNLTTVKLHYSIVYPRKRPPLKLWKFHNDLKGLDPLRVTVDLLPSSEMDCHLKAQLQRIFAFRDNSFRDEDVIVTSEVDIYPLKPSVLHDLDVYRTHKKVWLFHYDHTFRSGNLFSITYIGMTVKTWKKLIGYSETPEELYETFGHTLNLKKVPLWEVDRLILSRIILESELCSLPEDLPIWTMVELEDAERRWNPMYFNDYETCFHGSGYSTCDLHHPLKNIDGYPCSIWKFMPWEREKDIVNKQLEILSGIKPRHPWRAFSK
ncbi:uncharacterized protein [Lepeophtheirus salmonis]|uniref:uncharacterized protein n=1 Tax=Lepeophtheirus salmonis TaxID=72036 RepID=UPI001AE4FD85|nr:uncharacterized protein LOC121116464 [Lepeophtheirus salmonis]